MGKLDLVLHSPFFSGENYLPVQCKTVVYQSKVNLVLKKNFAAFPILGLDCNPYHTYPNKGELICPKSQGEMRIISFIDQPDVIRKILQHLGLLEESHAPLERDHPVEEITFYPSYSQLIQKLLYPNTEAMSISAHSSQLRLT